MSTYDMKAPDVFSDRHIGPSPDDVAEMLEELGYDSLDHLVDANIPGSIRFEHQLDLLPPRTEAAIAEELQWLSNQNRIFRSYIGQGYYACITPPVILRNLIENPQWYTPYTPYQAEISQGRLEALLNFQTMICDLTGLPIANASLLDESTAAAEAMTLCFRLQKKKEHRTRFLVQENCHPQTLAVLQTRAKPLGITIEIGIPETFDFDDEVGGILLQYPDTRGGVRDLTPLIERAHESGIRVVVAADLLSLTLLKPPGEMGADLVVGTTQRFGMPLGFGGPHAGYLSITPECQRQMPGRIVGISVDANGNPAYRLSLQTREQHIRRDKATSNICTAQALPAMVASMYAVYHGPERLRAIAGRINQYTSCLADLLRDEGYEIESEHFFDTITFTGGPKTPEEVIASTTKAGINVRLLPDGAITLSLDETVQAKDLLELYTALGGEQASFEMEARMSASESAIPEELERSTPYLQQEVFNRYHSETELMRYLDRLQSRDIGLTDSMIPLGSCTMKLNAAVEMQSVSLPGFANIHPFAPLDQTHGYQKLLHDLEHGLAELTGFSAISLQPNAGSQGEFAGLLAIRAYHESRGDTQRTICLIPTSAHGTNPASAVMAGMKVLGVQCDDQGNIDLDHLRSQAETHAENLAALMVTYPSTHGVFEETIREVCEIIHQNGGQVYLDGANMNAMVGLCRPADFGGDVCHLNLHKTFCIPHGGGGPGMGPIGVREHLAPFLPGHPNDPGNEESTVGPVSETPWGSGSILPISWAYIALMGHEGLSKATKVAILNANYIARRMEGHYDVLYKGRDGLVAHECILDCRKFKAAGIEVDDIAKRLMDYGFHAPTMSWPVPGTLMIEPTESECKAELDRFCEAMIGIRSEIAEVENGTADASDNLLKNAPHTAAAVISDTWDHAYPRERAAYPSPDTQRHKFWPYVGRVDNVAGDRNLVCTCPTVDAYLNPED